MVNPHGTPEILANKIQPVGAWHVKVGSEYARRHPHSSEEEGVVYV